MVTAFFTQHVQKKIIETTRLNHHTDVSFPQFFFVSNLGNVLCSFGTLVATNSLHTEQRYEMQDINFYVVTEQLHQNIIDRTVVYRISYT